MVLSIYKSTKLQVKKVKIIIRFVSRMDLPSLYQSYFKYLSSAYVDTSILQMLRLGLRSALKCGTFNSEHKECGGKVDWSHLEWEGEVWAGL